MVMSFILRDLVYVGSECLYGRVRFYSFIFFGFWVCLVRIGIKSNKYVLKGIILFWIDIKMLVFI